MSEHAWSLVAAVAMTPSLADMLAAICMCAWVPSPLYFCQWCHLLGVGQALEPQLLTRLASNLCCLECKQQVQELLTNWAMCVACLTWA